MNGFVRDDEVDQALFKNTLLEILNKCLKIYKTINQELIENVKIEMRGFINGLMYENGEVLLKDDLTVNIYESGICFKCDIILTQRIYMKWFEWCRRDSGVISIAFMVNQNNIKRD